MGSFELFVVQQPYRLQASENSTCQTRLVSTCQGREAISHTVAFDCGHLSIVIRRWLTQRRRGLTFDRKHDALHNYALLICKKKGRTNSGPTFFNIDIISDALSRIRRYMLAVLINRKVTTELLYPSVWGEKKTEKRQLLCVAI